MINGAWDVLQLIYVLIYWMETKGLTLEQIDLLTGVSPSDVSIANIPGSGGDVKVLDGVEGVDQDNAIGKEGVITAVEDEGKSD
jgi:hypothetical protein